ncbi:hypothetical protein [Actinomycetospora termitidis]|uniref:FtsK domain-containing protein n=1 Tax=Actinomycetospora termitidis TaxID=3053470 RepID=A0ABT7MFK2_9PSEU|nr:hypothetical protein [Actinomycetospora sp. Odt1-22]MDL5159450.1 hypothetical protein [Actinomycetospora sp. Odt1-22]
MSAPDEQQQRPVSTALVKVGSKALEKVSDAPGAAVVKVVDEVQRSYVGVIAFAADLRAWRTVAVRRAEYYEAKRRADAGAGKHPSPSDLTKIEQDQAKRTLKLAAAVAGTAVLLFALSVSQYQWDPWLYLAGGVPVVLLIAGRYYRARWVTALAPVSGPVLLALGIEGLRWWPSVIAAVLVALACEYRGSLVAPPAPAGPGTDKARPGVSLPKLWETVRLRLLQERITARHQHTRLLVVDGVEVGAAFGLTTHEPMTDKAVAAVAREVHVGQRWVRYVHPADEPVGELLVYWQNPLENTPPPPQRRFGDLRYGRPFSVGRNDVGALDELVLAYTLFLVFGHSGSGKSSVVRLMIDATEEMPDADLYGIDTIGASLLGAQQKRLGRGRVACGPEQLEEAQAILDHLLSEARRRSMALAAGEDYDEDGAVDDRFLVDDCDGRRGIVLVIGEYANFCQFEFLVTRLLDLAMVARKHAITIIVESPTLAKSQLGDGRAYLAQAMVKIAMACSNHDVVQGLGESLLDQGWRPDKLQPESEGRRNDAGIGYVYGSGRNQPRLTGFHPMDPDEAAERRRARRIDRNAWYVGRTPPVSTSMREVNPLDAVEVPEPLATLAGLAEEGDVHTAALLEALPDGWTARGVADALRPHGVPVGNVVRGGVQRKGYRRDQVVSAVQALDDVPSTDGRGRIVKSERTV